MAQSLALFALLVGFSTASSWAAGTLTVTVFSQDAKTKAKETLPGALVELSSKSNAIQPKRAMSDLDGVVTFKDLPPGADYVLTVASDGFTTTVLSNIKVDEGRETKAAATLLSQITEDITVVGREKIVDIDKGTQSQTTISAETFGDLPIAGRDYAQALSLAPGVQDSDGDGNPNVHGSRDRDFKTEVDGVSNTDPLTGRRQGNVNPDAIEEIQVIDSGADASTGGAVGGFAKIITKSGGDKYEWSLSLRAGNSTFDNDGNGGQDPGSFRLWQPALAAQGPIIKGNLWYSINHEYLDVSFPVPVLGGEGYTSKFKRENNLDKLTWQINPRNKLQFQYSSNPSEQEPIGVGTVAPLESSYRAENNGKVYTMKWLAPYSANFFVESTVGYAEFEFAQDALFPKTRNKCINNDQFNRLLCLDGRNNLYSGPWFADAETLTRRWSYRFDAEPTINEFLGGTHRIKFGGEMQRSSFSRDLNRRDLITLNSIQAIGSVDPTDPRPRPDAVVQYTTSFPRVGNTESDGTIYTLYVTDTFSPTDNLRVTAGFRFQREEITATGYTPFSPKKEAANYIAAVQDCIRSGENPTFCIAREVDKLTAAPLDDPANPRNVNGCRESPNPNLCDLLTGVTADQRRIRNPEQLLISNNSIDPRLSVAWDPGRDGRTSISASWGRYSGETFLAPFVNENGPDVTTRPLIFDQSGNLLGFQFGSGFSITTVNRNMRTSHNDEWVASVTRELAPEISLRVRYLNRRYVDQLQDIDLNHVGVLWKDLDKYAALVRIDQCRRIGRFADCTGRLQSTGAGGRPINAPDGVPDIQLVSPTFNNVFEIGNYNEAKYKAFIVELTRRFAQNWEASGSYTWSKSFGQAEDYAQALGDDPTTTQDERGPLSTDQRHVVKINGRRSVNWFGGMRVGASASWESGLPYSRIFQNSVFDFPLDVTGGVGGDPKVFGYSTTRTIYPSRQRNDRRNSPFYDFSLNFQKQFDVRAVKFTMQADVFNLLNDNRVLIDSVFEARNRFTGRTFRLVNATGEFGRRFEVSVKANF